MSDQLLPVPSRDVEIMAPAPDAATPSALHKVRRYLGFLLKYWWIPVITVTVSSGIGVAYVFKKTPTFVSYARMMETLKLRLPDGALFTEDSQNYLGTLTEVLQSETLRDLALTQMRAMSNTIEIPLGKDGQPPAVIIRVNGSAKSSVFYLEANSPNPNFTQNYLNALMTAFLDFKKNERKVISEGTLASISDQVQRYERDLKTEQDALMAYERTNNFTIVQEEATVAGTYLAKLRTQLSDLQLEGRLLDATENDKNLVKVGDTNGIAIGPIPSGGPAGNQSFYSDLQLLKAEYEKLGKYLRPKHPKMVKLQADIDRAEKLSAIYRQQSLDQLAASREANRLKIANLSISINEWERKVVDANTRISETERLRLNIQRVQSVYDRLVSLVQNVGISREIDQESLTILQQASPARRSYTSEKSALVLAVVGGLAAGLGMVLLIGIQNDRFTSIVEVSSKFGDAVIGMLPEMKQNGQASLALLEVNDSRHGYAEAFRGLRSALLFLATAGEKPKILLITSSMPGEGKSTVAANLARTLALSGSRVLLVDGDLRKGRLHNMFQLQNETGLVDLLAGTCDASAVIQTDTLHNLSFISRGKTSRNPGDLFLSAGIDQIFAQWRRDYDHVIIDSSPLFAADDVSCLAPKTDGVLFVVRRNHSSARITQEALVMLANRQANVLGVVFNGVNAASHSYHYYKYADYSTPADST